MTETTPVTTILPRRADDAGTYTIGSDRYAITVIGRTKTTITTRDDRARRIDGNGMSEAQSWVFMADPHGTVRVFTRRTESRMVAGCKVTKTIWRPKGSKAGRLTTGVRASYCDPSF